MAWYKTFKHYLIKSVILTLHLIQSKTLMASPNKIINIAIESNVRSYDPRYAIDANSQYIENLIHCSLIDFNEQGDVITQVAAEYPQWISPTTLSVSIRDDIYFANGKKLQVADVTMLYENLSKNAQFPRSGAFKNIKTIQRKDQREIIFELHQPDASFVSNLIVGIIPKEFLEKKPIDPMLTPTCGPFRVKSIDVADIHLTPNLKYQLTSTRKDHDLKFKIVKSEKTRFAKLRAGEIDISQNNISRDLIDDVNRKYPSLKVIQSPALKTTYLGFNFQDPIAGNHAVRTAIDLSIDRQAIINLLLGGLAKPAASMLPSEDTYANRKLEVTDQNLKKAIDILEKAGFKKKEGSPFRLQISYKTTTNSTRINIARAIASQLKKVGIKVIIETMEWGRFKQDIENGRVQIWSLSWIGFKDPDILRYAFSSESFPPNGGNRGRYKNDRVDQLTKEGIITPDPKKRKLIYDEVQNIIAREKPYVFLWHEKNFAIANKSINNFKLYRDGRLFSLTQVSKSN